MRTSHARGYKSERRQVPCPCCIFTGNFTLTGLILELYISYALSRACMEHILLWMSCDRPVAVPREPDTGFHRNRTRGSTGTGHGVPQEPGTGFHRNRARGSPGTGHGVSPATGTSGPVRSV